MGREGEQRNLLIAVAIVLGLIAFSSYLNPQTTGQYYKEPIKFPSYELRPGSLGYPEPSLAYAGSGGSAGRQPGTLDCASTMECGEGYDTCINGCQNEYWQCNGYAGFASYIEGCMNYCMKTMPRPSYGCYSWCMLPGNWGSSPGGEICGSTFTSCRSTCQEKYGSVFTGVFE